MSVITSVAAVIRHRLFHVSMSRVQQHGSRVRITPQKIWRSFSKVVSLEDRTTALLAGPANDSQVISLIREWKEKASTKENQGLNARGHKAMLDILQHWLSNDHYPRTTEPFMLLIQHFHAHSQEVAALSILDQWNLLLRGNIELAPPLEAFHLVILSTSPDQKVRSRVSLLDQLEKAHAYGNYSLSPTVETYAHVITAYHVAQEILPPSVVFSLQEKFVEEVSWKLTPDVAYQMIRGYSKAMACLSDDNDAMQWIDEFEGNLRSTHALRLALEVKNPDERVLSLVGRAYQSAIKRLATSGESSSDALKYAEKAKGMLDYLAFLKWADLPWAEHYKFVARCWSSPSLPKESADTVYRELLMRFEAEHAVNQKARLPLDFYGYIICFWTYSGNVAEAERLLYHVMQKDKQSNIKSSSHQQISRLHNTVLQGYYQQGDMEMVVSMFERTDPSIVRKESTYSTVLKAISRMPHNAVARSTEVWKTLEADPNVTANRSHYGALITTWSRSSSEGAAEYALEVLDSLETSYIEQHGKSRIFKPKQEHFASVITAFARRSSDSQCIQKAREVFDRMKKYYRPDTISYSAMISALANGKTVNCARNAEEMLNEMEVLAQLPEGCMLKANNITYTAVMRAWALSGSPDAPENAERLLVKLEEKYVNTGDEDFLPDAMAYRTVIHAWCRYKRPDSGTHAERILKKVAEVEEKTGAKILCTAVCSSVMLAFCRNRDKDSIAKVNAILQTMKDSVAKGNVDCAPDADTFRIVIEAWAQSNDPYKAEKAWDFLMEVLEDNRAGRLQPQIRPNVEMFTSVLKACIYTPADVPAGRSRALVLLALKLMDEFRRNDYANADTAIYVSLIEVFARHVHDGETLLKYASIAFKLCCNDGLVDKSMIKCLKKRVPALFRDLPRNGNKKLELPPEWTMNVLSDGQPREWATQELLATV